MPGAEKLQGKLLFPEKKNGYFFRQKGEKTVFPREAKVRLWPISSASVTGV